MRVKRPTGIELLVIVAIIGVLIALFLPAGDFDREHRYPAEAPSRGIPLTSVAGEYYFGDGRGTNRSLSILQDGRYSFVSSGCTGVHHRESGFVDESDGLFVLSPVSPQQVSVKPCLILMGWGARRYLIAPHEIPDFREAVIEGREPRDDLHGRFYVRLPIEQAEGLPDSPPTWANAVRQGLLLGQVTEVSSVGLAKIARVRVDLGVKDGVRQGMCSPFSGPGRSTTSDSGSSPPRTIRASPTTALQALRNIPSCRAWPLWPSGRAAMMGIVRAATNCTGDLPRRVRNCGPPSIGHGWSAIADPTREPARG
ncbi:MAG: hypothetical protein U0790_06390 [Isosphaeraceae bacterium]